MFRLTAAERKTLLVAGAAAGMSATFSAPVASVLLALELLLFEFKPRSFVPVSLASAVAMLVRVLVARHGTDLFRAAAHDGGRARRDSRRARWSVCSPAVWPR